MNNITTLLHNNFGQRLPVIMMGIIGLGCVLFSAIVIMPQWKLHEDTAAQVELGQQEIAATMTMVSQSDEAVFLQRQVEGAQTNLDKSSTTFLTQTQADDLMQRVYEYARISGSKIASLQAQAANNQPVQKDGEPVYNIRMFHLQVNGSVIQLMNFIILIRESSLPGVIVNALSVARSDTQYSLVMNLAIHISPLASGNALDSLDTQPDAVMIAVTPTLTPTLTLTPTITQTPTATMTATATFTASPSPTPTSSTLAATLIGQCAQQSTQTMQELHFTQIQHGTGTCDIQAWAFTVDKQENIVLDIVRYSGGGQYRMELRDSTDKTSVTTLSSVDGRGILVANPAVGSYTLAIVPLSATGTWAYDIAVWEGLPALSFSWAQNSSSSHTNIGTESNVMTWTYTLSGGTQSYHIDSTRTDGNLEYGIIVSDDTGKQIASAQSSSGNATVALTTGRGTYSVKITTVAGTSGSYRIALVHS